MSIDTRWTFSVTAGSNLQDVLNAARPGDIIQLQAGATFVGNFTLPAKPQNQNSPQWIVIRSDASDANLPPAGTRVQPSFAPFLPKLVSPNQDPALKTDAGAEFYSLFGVELTVDPSVSENGGVVAFGDGSQTSLSEVPSNLVLDRCYIHGTPTQNTYRGVALNSAYTTITECYISDFHKQRLADSGGPDAQAISGWNGPGPFQIVNCYLEGGDENVLFGGVDPAITDLVPSNITFSSNYCSKPFSWRLGDPSYDGRDWRIKNIFELKNAQRVMIEGNVFEHCWVNGDQNATAIVFTPRNQDGAAPWSVVQDVIFRNNIVLHSGQGLRTLGVDDTHQSLPLKRITIENNLFADIDGDKWGREGTAVDGRWLGITGGGGSSDITVNHNTAFQERFLGGRAGAVVFTSVDKTNGFVFRNNIAPHNDCMGTNNCGVSGDGTGPGVDTLQMYFPGYQDTFLGNIIPGAPANNYPLNNFYPTTLQDVGFVDLSDLSGGGNYRLATTSPYKGQGTDRTDPGCNIDTLEAATSVARSGIRL